MPIPDLDQRGCLPPGLYDCSLAEIGDRFGAFRGSDKRVKLYDSLVSYAQEARDSRLVKALIVDGSFITSKPDPGDIDLIVVLEGDLPQEDLPPAVYNTISKRKVKSRYPFDLVVVQDGDEQYQKMIQFFAQVKEKPESQKGLLRVEL